jgi:hypothetical protein
MSWLQEFWYRVIIEWLPGDFILELVDQYFTFQSDPEKVLMVVGITALAAIGLLSIVKSILKMASNVIKVSLFLGLAYYVFVIVLGIDIWGEIFNAIF